MNISVRGLAILTVNCDEISVQRNAGKNRPLKLKFEIKKMVTPALIFFIGKVMINMVYFFSALTIGTNRQTNRQTGRQTNRRTYREIDRWILVE